LFPRLVNLRALRLRWFRVSMRESFGEFYSPREDRMMCVLRKKNPPPMCGRGDEVDANYFLP
jgi:hypothetical protein